MNNIILVAPYSPVGTPMPNLGAANKIASVIRILSQFDRRVVLINSAHNYCQLARATSIRQEIGGSQTACITPFTLRSRPLGKFLNLLATRQLAHRIARLNPALVWIYNSYAFEAKFALELQSITSCPIVLELEDWPTARRRGLNPKPMLDAAYFRKLLPKTSLVTLVNQALTAKLPPECNTFLLPGVIAPQLMQTVRDRVRFSTAPFTLGYFGQLNAEKGADIILDTVMHLPPSWRAVVTGSGELAKEFHKVAANSAGRVSFFQGASSDELYRQMCSCDVIVNPHKPIAQMENGVFPFKVVEALATGALLISTELPESGLMLDDAAIFFSGDSSSLLSALERAPRFYADRQDSINSVAAQVRNRYSESVIASELRTNFRRMNAFSSDVRANGSQDKDGPR